MTADHIISASYGNDSIALIQWARERRLKNVVVAYCDTGWAAPGWDQRVDEGEALAKRYLFDTVRIRSMGMEDLVRHKQAFPGNAQQFCTAHLKGVPFLRWVDAVDPLCEAAILIGKRRAESRKRANTPEFVESSEYHGGRRVWHPLFQHTDDERNALLSRAGFVELPHRSQECSPCVNANRSDFRLLTPEQVARVRQLEQEIGKTMFRPQRFKAKGIDEVMRWAWSERGKFVPEDEDEGCGSPFGCRT
jgi:hypothetical protein